MSYVVGVAGLLALGALYVGLRLADRGRDGCGGCAMSDPDDGCGWPCSTEDTRSNREGALR